MKRLIAALLAGGMLASLGAPALAAEQPQHTVEQTIRLLGVMNGDENGDMNLEGLVTRAQFAKMMTAASSYKDSVGQVSGVSPFRDVTRDHWAAGYVKLAADNGWVNGYTDGTFRPNENIRTEECAAALLRLLGYGPADLTGAYPGAQLSKFRALGLADGVSRGQGEYLTRSDCMQIFYNLMEAKTKEGQYYGAVLGYQMGQDGKLDYAGLISGNMEGPFIAEADGLRLPFEGNITVYLNGAKAGLEDVQAYDVYYYNANLKTAWVYHNRVTGLYTAAAPGTAAPTSVTVAGNQYGVSSSQASYALSDMGQFSIGDTVTLLLGLDGQVAGVQRAETAAGQHYGVVVSTSSQTYQDAAGQSRTRNMAKISCTDGAVMEFDSGATKFSAGDLVYAAVEEGKTALKGLAGKSLSGAVSSDGKRIGQLTLAEGVQIIDSDKDGQTKVIYPSRLAGASLKSADVRYYALDASGRVSHLILNDATGDLGSYGVITSASEVDQTIVDPNTGAQSWTISGTYKTLIRGAEGVVSGNKLYNVKVGPAQFTYDDDRAVKSMRNLPEVRLTSLSQLYAMAGNQRYRLADDVQVYIRTNRTYDQSNVSAVSSGYNLTGYYDQGGAAGGLIRVIIATKQ